MGKIPFDSSCEAEYEDGYVHSETELDDIAMFKKADGEPDGNVFRDILSKKIELIHGPMIRFSVFYHNARYDLDWRNLPENARPIRFRDRSAWKDTDGNTGVSDWHGCRFGYQWNDENGKNHQFIEEL